MASTVPLFSASKRLAALTVSARSGRAQRGTASTPGRMPAALREAGFCTVGSAAAQTLIRRARKVFRKRLRGPRETTVHDATPGCAGSEEHTRRVEKAQIPDVRSISLCSGSI